MEVVGYTIPCTFRFFTEKGTGKPGDVGYWNVAASAFSPTVATGKAKFVDMPVTYTMTTDAGSEVKELSLGPSYYWMNQPTKETLHVFFAGVGLSAVWADHMTAEDSCVGEYVHCGYHLSGGLYTLGAELRYTLGTNLDLAGAGPSSPTDADGLQLLLVIGLMFF
ncbi:MAG: hypothetical protein ACYTKD_28810 [Planctomycetota bacterium]|jgi:hypothetical protein